MVFSTRSVLALGLGLLGFNGGGVASLGEAANGVGVLNVSGECGEAELFGWVQQNFDADNQLLVCLEGVVQVPRLVPLVPLGVHYELSAALAGVKFLLLLLFLAEDACVHVHVIPYTFDFCRLGLFFLFFMTVFGLFFSLEMFFFNTAVILFVSFLAILPTIYNFQPWFWCFRTLHILLYIWYFVSLSFSSFGEARRSSIHLRNSLILFLVSLVSLFS